MLAHNNILKPQDGKPVMSPSQDMVIGCYYLTIDRPDGKGAGRVFSSPDEAMMAYQLGQLSLQAPIKVRLEREFNGEKGRKIIDCTLGLLLFNEVIPQDIGRKPRTCLEEMFPLEIDGLVGKKELGKIVDEVYLKHGIHETAQVLDNIKNLGFKYSTPRRGDGVGQRHHRAARKGADPQGSRRPGRRDQRPVPHGYALRGRALRQGRRYLERHHRQPARPHFARP